MNILQISEYLKGVPKDFLVKEATLPSGNYPQYLVVSELSRRTAMEKQFAGINAQQNQPQETVAERTVREATPMPMAAMQGIKSPQTTYQEEPSGQETMGVPAAVRMFEGGRVSFEKGGFLDRVGRGVKSFFTAGQDPYMGAYGGLTEEKMKRIQELEAAIEAGSLDPIRGDALIQQLYQPTQLSEQTEMGQGIMSELEDLGVEKSLLRSRKGEREKRLNELEIRKRYARSDEEKNRLQADIDRITELGQDYSDLGTVAKEVAKDQKTKAGETTPPETKKPKGEPKEKAPKLNFDKYVEEKLPLKPLLENMKKEVMEQFPDLNEQTVGELLQGVKDLRSEDYTAKMKGLVDEIEDEALKADMQAIPNAIVAFGIGIANGDPSKGILGGAVDGLAQAFGVFQNQKKEAREIRRMKREAMGNLYQMASAQQEGDIKEAQRQKDMYTQNNNTIQMAEAQMSFELAKEALTDNRARLLLMVERKSKDIDAAFDMAKTQIAADTQLQLASAQQKQKYIQDFLKQNFDLDKILLDPANTALLDDEKLGMLQGQIDQAKKQYAGALADLLEVGSPEGMKGGGMTKVDRKPKSLFDFHRE